MFILVFLPKVHPNADVDSQRYIELYDKAGPYDYDC